MKHVLIAGKDSYIGGKLTAWLDTARYRCHTLDMRTDAWKQHDFSTYDAVVMVAGIAHQRETAENRALYDLVNHRLAAETAAAAKAAGVRQFVFFSSMSVYGLEVGRITADTREKPVSAYGQSKLDAEKALKALDDEKFHVAVLRPPMIYGPGCKGNYPRLAKLIRKLRVLPKVANERSMLYIDTLCRFMDSLLQSGDGGLYFPQNSYYVSTNALASAIANAHGFRLLQPRGLGWLLQRFARRGGTIGKVFGTLTYDQTMSEKFRPNEQATLTESIAKTEAAH